MDALPGYTAPFVLSDTLRDRRVALRASGAGGELSSASGRPRRKLPVRTPQDTIPGPFANEVIAVILDLTEIVEQPGERWEVPADFAPASTPDLCFVGPATGAIVVQNTGTELVFCGSVAAKLGANCSRCLEPFHLALTGEVEADLPLRAAADLLTGKPVELEPDLAAALSPDGADLAELTRQALLLALPLRSICSSHCKGLCPGCGQNLNTGSCECTASEVDPRLQALASWRAK